jgi:hypothetical protein
MDLDELPMSSVIYVGRGSFRMEAVALDSDGDGAVQAVAPVVTAPLHATPIAQRRDSAPALRSLFGSQVDVPLLAAPTGAVSLPAPVVTLTRATLATVCGIVLLCGIVVGTAARHLLASPAPRAVAAAPSVVAPAAALPASPALAPLATPSAPVADTAPPLPPPIVTLPAPVTIRAHAKAVARAVPAAKIVVATPPKAWVDPWAN